ncbi:MAG: restriction endonuclease subunit S, partial [Campylobacteraceae bacterium]|nr:restriction endonuclease subunit S [Campylobacteraceae bacterium]
IGAIEKLIAKKRAIKQGVMQQLLTGKRRLTGFNSQWTEKRIYDIGYTYSGLIGKRKEHFGQGKARYITFLNVLMNTVIDTSIFESVDVAEHENQNAVKRGDLFFNTSSETPEEVGMCAVLAKSVNDTYLNSFCFGFRLTDREIDCLFLSYYFNSNEGRKIMTLLAQGATRYNLSKIYFNNTLLLLPTLAEQQAIAKILSDIDAQIDALIAKLNKAKNIKQGMMSELLTGRIRLVEIEQESRRLNKTVKIHKNHNQQFDDAVMIGGIVNAFYSDKYLLGRKKVQKLLYFSRRHQDKSTAAFKKKAAGPYADEVRYKGGEPIAIERGYVVTTINKGTIFAKGEKISQALDYIQKWDRQADIQWLVEKFLYKKVDELELLATVDMAICELKTDGASVTVNNIKNLIANNDQWRDKLKRQFFSDEKIAQAIWNLETLFYYGG